MTATTTTTTDPLVSTEWLAAHLGDPKVRVIDASFKLPGVLPLPKDDYLASHIPGAVLLPLEGLMTWPAEYEKVAQMIQKSRKPIVTYCA